MNWYHELALYENGQLGVYAAEDSVCVLSQTLQAEMSDGWREDTFSAAQSSQVNQ